MNVCVADPKTPMGSCQERATGGDVSGNVNVDQTPPRRLIVPPPMPTPQYSQGEVMVREVERSRARIFDVQGKEDNYNGFTSSQHYFTSPDEDYLMVGNHIEDSLRKKIVEGEYVDFARLLPKDRVLIEDDHRMEMVNKGGLSYWVPLSDRDSATVNSFYRWEQAFRVFSNIYMEAYPSKLGELIQYNHVIHTASQTYAWDNVYHYDREFRLHMSKHHLTRSRAVILQQAWSMYLKDKVNHQGNGQGNRQGQGSQVRRKLCFDFNRGECTYGQRCKFDHRCSFCNKFGHGAFNCR